MARRSFRALATKNTRIDGHWTSYFGVTGHRRRRHRRSVTSPMNALLDRWRAPSPVQQIEASAWAAASALASLAAHAAWHAANARSFLWNASAHDYEKLEAVAEVLEDLIPPATARAIRQLALSAAWYASNTRRLLLLDAARDWRRFSDIVTGLGWHLPSDMTRALRTLTISAAWHAANARSMLWRDAERDVQRFEACCRRLPGLLQRSAICSLLDERNSPCPGLPAATRTPRAARRPWSAVEHLPRTASTLTKSGRATLQRTHCVLDDVIPLWQTVADACAGAGNRSANDSGRGAGGPREAHGGGDGGSLAGNGVLCSDFLEAAFATAAVFECLGATVAPMASELQKNAEKLRKAMMLRPGLTIREMIVEEASLRGIGRRRAADVAVEGSASLALIWLERLLRMLLGLMARLAEDESAKLSDCIARSYDETLRPYHALWTQRVILAAAWTAPSRADFLTRLGSDRAAVEQSIVELLVCLEPALASVRGDVLENLGEAG